MAPTFPILVILATLAGCSAASSGFSDSPYGQPTDTGTSTALDSAMVDSGNPKALEREPIYWSLGGELVIDGKGIDLKATSLHIDFRDAKLVLTCKEPTALVIAKSVSSPSPDEKLRLANWFTLTLDNSPSAGVQCPGWPAGILELGLGYYDGSLDPALAAHGYTNSSPYGLFVRDPQSGSQVYLIGVGGTEEMFEGVEIAAADLPLPPGTYRLQSLIVMSL